jgi:hypothetical protein
MGQRHLQHYLGGLHVNRATDLISVYLFRIHKRGTNSDFMQTALVMGVGGGSLTTNRETRVTGDGFYRLC